MCVCVYRYCQLKLTYLLIILQVGYITNTITTAKKLLKCKWITQTFNFQLFEISPLYIDCIVGSTIAKLLSLSLSLPASVEWETKRKSDLFKRTMKQTIKWYKKKLRRFLFHQGSRCFKLSERQIHTRLHFVQLGKNWKFCADFCSFNWKVNISTTNIAYGFII